MFQWDSLAVFTLVVLLRYSYPLRFLPRTFKGNAWGSFILCTMASSRHTFLACAGVSWLLHRAHPKWMPTFRHVFNIISVGLGLSFRFLFCAHFNDFLFEFVSGNHHLSGRIVADTFIFLIRFVANCRGFVWFFCLMAYQSFSVNICQGHSPRNI